MSQSLIVKAGVLKQGETYTFSVNVSESGSNSFSLYRQVTVNEPPTGGSCTVSPTDGIAFTTTFSVTCSGFTDEHNPLSYRFYTGMLADSSRDTRIGSAANGNLSKVFLPAGLAADSYIVSTFTVTQHRYTVESCRYFNRN